MNRKAFTLIELLIVVAIIAILAAIAVPNFLEAQVRAKVSRSKADMRTIVTALESYVVDNNKYPDISDAQVAALTLTGNPIPQTHRLSTAYSRVTLSMLSTPISYVSTGLFNDPFAVNANPGVPTSTQYFGFGNLQAVTKFEPFYPPSLTAVSVAGKSVTDVAAFGDNLYALQSVGPDRINHAFIAGFAGPFNDLTNTPTSLRTGDFFYDPTNGTVSRGDIVRTAKFQN